MAGKKGKKTMASEDTLPIAARILTLSGTIHEMRSDLLNERRLLPGHDDFLIEIAKAPGISMGDLAVTLDISPSSATKIATKLEALGLMRRETSRIDNRQNHAFLTEAGDALVADLQRDRLRIDETLSKSLKTKDAERLAKILDRLEGRKSPVGKKPRKAGSKTSKSKKSDKKDK